MDLGSVYHEVFSNPNLLKIIQEHNRVVDWLLDSYKYELESKTVPKFWGTLLVAGDASNNMVQAVNFLHGSFVTFVKFAIDIMEKTKTEFQLQAVKSRFLLVMRCCLQVQLPINFDKPVTEFYTTAFEEFWRIEQLSNEQNIFKGPEYIVDISSSEILQKFHSVNQKLCELELLERLASDSITTIIHEKITEYVKGIKGNFGVSNIRKFEQWLNSVVLRWLASLYNIETSGISQSPKVDVITRFKDRLRYFLFETYADCLLSQLFDIIIDFPESKPAIQDLRSCLNRSELKPKVILPLRAAFEARLLHPGVNTKDILEAYISAIKALKMLDSTGVILEQVSEPIRVYLRGREDTVRCIVQGLLMSETDDREMAAELKRAEPLVLDDSCQNDDDVGENWDKWMPDPVEADPSKTKKNRRTADVMSMLVNIYGSRDLFITEYRALLADRLITQFNFDSDRERMSLELLKLRFGDDQLHFCDVMLKDIDDSSRFNARIVHSGDMNMYKAEDFPVYSMVISSQFWPTFKFKEDKLAVPDRVLENMKMYTKAYEVIKGNRTLEWKPHLGLVHVELALTEGRVLSYSVSPVHATIIMKFEEKPEWSLEELSTAIQASSAVVRRKLSFWQGQGLIKELEQGDRFVLTEDNKMAGHGNKDNSMIVDDDEEEESIMASSHDQKEEELQVFWGYIVGMLGNLESLPLDRIHSMLRMFATNTVQCTSQELRQFLDKKVNENKLLFSGGMYRLPKPVGTT